MLLKEKAFTLLALLFRQQFELYNMLNIKSKVKEKDKVCEKLTMIYFVYNNYGVKNIAFV